MHQHVPPGIRAVYGRVEIVDRSWDDPNTWVQAAAEDGEDLAEMLEIARTSIGHYYMVSDSLDASTYLLVDGQFAAIELTPVSEAEALAGIAEVRTYMAALTRSQRGLARLGLPFGPIGACTARPLAEVRA